MARGAAVWRGLGFRVVLRRAVFDDFLFFSDAAAQFDAFGAEFVVFLLEFGAFALFCGDFGAEFGYFPLMENFVNPVEYQLCTPDFLRLGRAPGWRGAAAGGV